MALPPEEAVKLSMRIDAPLWRAWTEISKRAGYDPIDNMRMMMISEVTKADPPVLEDEESARLKRLDRLIRKVVEIAVAMFRNGEFTPDLTLHVFQRAIADDAFRKDYIDQIGGADPYAHGNPLKEVNRELGWRIKNAIPVEVVKDSGGKPVEVRNLKGQVIQSYTRLKLRQDD
jgi:hypothetical protein